MTTDLPIDGASLILIPLVDNLLNEATISRVTAPRVRLRSPSPIKYNDLGTAAIGQREHTEFVRKGLWSEDQSRNIQLSLSASISSPGIQTEAKGVQHCSSQPLYIYIYLYVYRYRYRYIDIDI